MARVLITGCSTGIGRLAAATLAARGHDVVATARQVSALEGLDVAQRLELDVTSDDSVAAAVATAGELDVLVNNAAWGAIGPIETIPLAEVRAMYDTNVLGVLRMIQAVLPGMRSRSRGTIVNLSSAAGWLTTMPMNGPYASTKSALEALTETLHYEVRRFGVRVVSIQPGYTATAWAGNERWSGVDQPPWDELHRLVRAHDDDGQEGAAPAQDVVDVIVAAIEGDDPPLRMAVGDEVRGAIEARRASSDRDWEAYVDDVRPFRW